jgi:3,4-dihydroxy 2-butanone 4-phosphate synthase / GTP cyclohydrolase II
MTILESFEHLRRGQALILVDDESRENEGDLVVAAEFADAAHINFMAKEGRGLICLALPPEKVDQLELKPMTTDNQARRKTAFLVSIEAREGITTGISAVDRATTIQAAIAPEAGPRNLASPGHVFPLRAREGGVLVRAGHTEGSVDLCKMAKLSGAAVICEIMKDDGTMARRPDLEVFAAEHGIPILTIADLIQYRLSHECLVEPVGPVDLPLSQQGAPLKLFGFKSQTDGSEHIALVKGPIDPTQEVLVRMHSECLTGDVLGSLRCDCGPQLQESLRRIQASPQGVLVYLRNHEGRGIGLLNKIRAYALQDQGLDTVEANHSLGFQSDLRDYGIGAQILRALNVRHMILLTNNPKKIVNLRAYGIHLVRQEALKIPPNPFNHQYLKTKLEKLGHLLEDQKSTPSS